MLIRLNSTLRGQAGIHALAVELPAGTSVRDALAQTVNSNPAVHSVLTDARGEVRTDLVIFRNGRNIRFQGGLDTTLATSDKLDLFPETGGQRAFA